MNVSAKNFARPDLSDQYKTTFGHCPSSSAGKMTLKLIEDFKENKSLFKLKKKIIEDKLADKHYLKNYEIQLDPIDNTLHFALDCPKVLLKVEVLNKKGRSAYESLLVDNGRLFDPTYEVLLRSEGKLKGDLPYLTLSMNSLNKDLTNNLAELILELGENFRQKLSEMVINPQKELTVIMGIEGRASSVFLGRENWSLKLRKLKKIIAFMEQKRKIPTIINLTDPQKVVVKFNSQT